MFRIVPFPNDELREHMGVRAQEVGLSIAGDGVRLLEKAAT